MLQARLIVVGGEVKTQEVKLKLPTVIGRGKEANLKVPLALVSRKHCEIRERDGRLFIRDLGSLNGTFVNNYKITAEQPLLPGELVTVGSITFRADYELSPRQAAEVVSARSSEQAVKKQPSPPRTSEEQIVFNPVASEKPTDRAPNKKTPAASAAIDATVAGTISVSVNAGSPVKLNEAASPKPAKPQVAPAAKAAATPPPAAPVSKETAPSRAKLEPAKREEIATPSLPARHGDQFDQDNVLDDFPLETTAQKSISLSALEGLQFNAPRQVSFVGNLNFGGAALEPASEAVRIDLGKNEPSSPSTDDSADSQLDSFLRRIALPSE